MEIDWGSSGKSWETARQSRAPGLAARQLTHCDDSHCRIGPNRPSATSHTTRQHDVESTPPGTRTRNLQIKSLML